MSKTAVPAPGQGRVPPRPSGRGRQGHRPPQTDRRPNAMSARANIRRRRRRLFVAFGSIAVVTGVAAALVVVALVGGNPSSDAAVSPPKGSPLPAALTAKFTSVPLSTLDAAPTGGLNMPAAIDDPPLAPWASRTCSTLVRSSAPYAPPNVGRSMSLCPSSGPSRPPRARSTRA